MRRALMIPMTAMLLATPPLVAQEGDEGVLGGPSVLEEAEQTPPGIVHRSFDGTLERPEGLPEMAALDLIELEGDAKRAVEDALAERNAAIDAILSDHLDLFQKTITLFQSGAQRRRGRNDEFRGVMREVRTVVAPVAERGTLREEIVGALEGDALDDFERMMDEWDEAVAQETPEGREGMRPERRSRAGGRYAEELRKFSSLLREFGSSYQRVIGQRVEDYRAMLDELDVDDETKGAIEAAVQGSLSEMTDDPEGYDRAALFKTIMDELTPQQRRRLIEELRRVRGERGGEAMRDR